MKNDIHAGDKLTAYVIMFKPVEYTLRFRSCALHASTIWDFVTLLLSTKLYADGIICDNEIIMNNEMNLIMKS